MSVRVESDALDGSSSCEKNGWGADGLGRMLGLCKFRYVSKEKRCASF